MQLQSLYIKDYKLLKDFRVEFNQPLSLFIGKNGSGKSTVLEALALIFKSAHLYFVENKRREKTIFEFEVKYLLQQGLATTEIILKGENDNLDFWSIYQNERYLKINSYEAEEFLPRNVIVYYAGWFKTMQTICLTHENIYKKRLKEIAQESHKGFKALEAQPMFYIQGSHFEMLMAALLSFEFSEEVTRFFEDKIGIDFKPLKISINLRNLKPQTLELGLIGYFIENLRKFGTENLGQSEFSKKYVFSSEQWYNLKNEYGEEKRIFYLLNMLRSAGLLGQIQIQLKKLNGEIISVVHLSEGEQQLITIKAINELLIEDNTLLLFDEPDTYLHPSLQDDLIKNIQESIVSEDLNQSHYVITSHNPSLLNNLNPLKGELYIMQNGNILPHNLKWYGRDVNEVVHQVMDSEYRPKWALDEIQEIDLLIDREDFDTAKSKLNILITRLSDSDSEIVRLQTKLDFFVD